MSFFKNIKKTLKSTWICMQFPFLYPRNVFTGRNRKNVLGKMLDKLRQKAIYEIGVTAILERKLKNENNRKYGNIDNINNIFVKLHAEDESLEFVNSLETKIFKLKYIIWDNKFDILGLTHTLALSGKPIIKIIVTPKDKTDDTNYGFSYGNVEMIISHWYYFWYKVFHWIDSEVLDRILFLPTYTLLTFMEPGWKKAFGIQMCKDLRKQLIKEHYLFKYRIVQIKEKWGYLHWYDNGHSDEVHKIISKYENLSWNTCIICGKPSTKISSGWNSPYCDDCYPNRFIVYKEKINDEWVETDEYKKMCDELYNENKNEK